MRNHIHNYIGDVLLQTHYIQPFASKLQNMTLFRIDAESSKYAKTTSNKCTLHNLYGKMKRVSEVCAGRTALKPEKWVCVRKN